MHHEKVLANTDDRPIHHSLDNALVFDRVHLCVRSLRNKRLGCAHSRVNLNFERILEQLEIAVPQCMTQIFNYKNEFKSLIIKMYALDHKVGHLEHDIAVCKLNFDSYGNGKLEQVLLLLKTEHRQLVSLLSKIKTDIEQLIITEINYSYI
jgi:hypothetical protein